MKKKSTMRRKQIILNKNYKIQMGIEKKTLNKN